MASFTMAAHSIATPRHPAARICCTRRHHRIVASIAAPTELAPASASLYQVLGLPAGATRREIKAAYRQLARVWHPDAAGVESAGKEFMRIHAAYNTLSDPDKRVDYDQRLLLLSLASAARIRRRGAFQPAFSGVNRRRTWETDQCW